MPADFHMGSGERCPSEFQPARASRLLAGAGAPGFCGSTWPHTGTPAVSQELEQSCSPRRGNIGTSHRGEGCAVGGAPRISYDSVPLRQTLHSLQPPLLHPSLLIRREPPLRRSWSKAAVHAETRSGHRREEGGGAVGGAPSLGWKTRLLRALYRAQWLPLRWPAFALRGGMRADYIAVAALRGRVLSHKLHRGGFKFVPAGLTSCIRESRARSHDALGRRWHVAELAKNAPSTRRRKLPTRKTVYSNTTA